MLNKVMIMGRLTANPDFATTQDGKVRCKFGVAVARPKKKDSEMQDTDFFNCVAWNGTAQLVNDYYSKGDIILFSGYLRNSTYEKNGEKRTTTTLVAREVYFTYSKKTADNEQSEDIFGEII